MRLVMIGDPPAEPRLGPTGYNGSSKRHVGVELDDGTIVDTRIALESFSLSDYSSCYGSHDHAELLRCADGWIIQVINESGEVTGPMDTSITVYFSADGRSWNKVDDARRSLGEPISRLG